MADVRLHYRPGGNAPRCAVCGVAFRGTDDDWWLRHTWTDRRDDYRDGESSLPGEWLRVCGRMADGAREDDR